MPIAYHKNPLFAMIGLVLLLLIGAIPARAADLNILVLGSSRSYSNEQYPGVARNQQPFNPQLVADELQNILNDDSSFGTVTVRIEDISANTITRTLNNPTANASSRSYSLLNYYYWPDNRTNRLANLKGEGTGPTDKAWNYVIIMGDPSFITNLPGVYAMGVKLIVDTVRQGTAEPILMMQWPHAGSSVPVADFGEVTYRIGDSGGIPVAPAGFAWNDYTSKDSGPHPTPDGAYLAAATLYNKMLGRDAASDSTYIYKNSPTTSALATLANNTVQTHNAQSHYSGAFNQLTPHKRLDDKDRVIRGSNVASSTEDGFVDYGPYNSNRHLYGLLKPQLSLENYTDNPSGFSGIQHFYVGRNNPSGSTRYVVQPATYRTTYAFSYQIRNQDDPEGNGGLEMLYGIDTISGSYRGDQRTAFDLISLDHVSSGVRVLPIHSIWAAAKDQIGLSTPFFTDGNHYGAAVNEAAVSYMMTHLTGRCPIGKNGTTAEQQRRSIGYDTSWIMSTLNLRTPGFTTQPSAYNAKTVTPGTSETMSVYFVNPPQSTVTVSVSPSASTAAIVNPKTLTFDATNHDTIQNVRMTGLPGSSAAEAFAVNFASTSTDMCFANLSDSWKYTNNRASTETLSMVNQSDRQQTTSRNVNKTIDLQVSGSSEGNTVLAHPFHGILSWSGANLIYSPDSDYIGNDSFAFAVNTGGTLTKGYIQITVEDLPSVVINESGGSTIVAEGGATDTYTLQLSESPAANVTVTVTPDAEITVSPTALTFTTGDWSTPQTVTVTAVNDSDHEGFTHSGTISHSTSSSDPDWNAITVNNITATITDNDNATPTVDAGSNQTVALAGDGSVTINLSGTVNDADGDSPTINWSMFSGPSGATVNFGNGNSINTTAGFTVAGSYVLRLTANDGYSEVFDEVTITVNPPASALSVSISPASISENGGTATATVSRNSDTTNALAVTLVTSDTGEATVVSGNIPAGQSSADFTITAVDDGSLDGTQTVTITASAAGHFAGSDTIEITDDEVPATYTVSYNGNGNTGGTAASNQTKTQHIDLTLATNSGSLVKTDHTFVGWNTSSNGSGTNYAEGATYSTDANLTLYAKWTYSGSGGVTSITVENHSFEAGTNSSGGGVSKPPWRKAGTGSNSIAIQKLSGIPGKADPSPDGTDSTHYTNSTGDNIYQVLVATLAANSTYRMRVDIGDRTDLSAQSGSIRLGYVSTSPTTDHDYGLNLLDATVVNNAIPVNGAGASDGWTTWESTFTTGASPAGLGRPLRIELVTAGGVQTLWDNVRLEVTSTPTNTLASWISGYNVGAQTAATDDPDGDGIRNAIENFFGTDPSASSTGLVMQSVDSGANTLTFTHPINDTPASDLTATYRWSKNLTDFHNDGVSDGTTTVTFSQGSPSGGMVDVTATVTGTAADKIFVVISVIQN